MPAAAGGGGNVAEGEEAIGANEARDARGAVGELGVGETPPKNPFVELQPGCDFCYNDLGP